MKKNYEELAHKYGRITFEGKEYAVTDEAYEDDVIGFYNYGNRTNRLDEIEEGEEYSLVMVGDAIDKKGNEYRVTWHFKQIRGEEVTSLELLDWEDNSNVYQVEAV